MRIMMTFADTLKRKLQAADENVLLEILAGGFIFDYELEGELCGFRRSQDEILDEEGRKIRTTYYCYPQNGQKGKLKMGTTFSIESEITNPGEKISTFANAGALQFSGGGKYDLYYSHVASRGGKQIAKMGSNTHLHHKVLIVTPEKKMIPLDEFNFAENSLFMLGLYGGEYQIAVQQN